MQCRLGPFALFLYFTVLTVLIGCVFYYIFSQKKIEIQTVEEFSEDPSLGQKSR